MNEHRPWRLATMAVIAVGLMAWTVTVQAQAPRLRGPGLRAAEREKQAEETKELTKPIVPSVRQPAAEPDADNSPAAESYRKGVESLDKGETDAAIAHFSRAIQLDPKYAPAYCDRGLALVMKGELDKAVADLDTAIRLAPTGARSYFNRGFAYFQKGEYDKAVADYTDAIRLHPELRRGVSRSGLRPHAEGRLGAGLGRPELCRPAAPKDPAAYTSRGKAYSEMGDWERAIADYSQAIQLEPQDAENWCDRGNARVMKGDYDGGAGRRGAGDETGPRRAQQSLHPRLRLSQEGRLDKAVADFNEVIRLDPQFGEAYRERGHTLCLKGDLDKAMADLNKAIELVPEDYEALFCRGYACGLKGDLDKALADYDQAIKLDSAFAEAHFNRALVYWWPRTNPDKALADYREVIRLDPRKRRGLQGLGTGRRQGETGQGRRSAGGGVAQGEGRGADAFAAGHRAAQGGTSWTRPSPSTIGPWSCIPATPKSITTAAWPTARRTDLAKAIADYTQAIRLDPKYIPAYANRGYVYYTRGDYDRALADFNKILELDPNNADAMKGREAIVKRPKAGE